MSDVAEVSIERTKDMTLTPYSHSMLNLINTCPTQGLVTYVGNRVMRHSSRAMPLEAGSAAHEAYAAARVWQIGKVQGLDEHAKYHGTRLFGEDRFMSMQAASADAHDDSRNAMLRFCLEAFYTCGFYDDPSDKRRTFTNIEEALIAYLDRYDFKRDVWVQDRNDPTAMVGIELPIDMTLSYALKDGSAVSMRFIGTGDGVTVRNEEFRLEENKTASRLGEAWAYSFWTSHQVTGYMLGIQTCYGIPVTKCAAHGMCIPLPRSYDAGGLMTEVVSRTNEQYSDFLSWALHTKQIIDVYGNDPANAPKNTGACNKYFRPCSLIPLCASGGEDRTEMYDEMVQRDLTPTEKTMEEID